MLVDNGSGKQSKSLAEFGAAQGNHVWLVRIFVLALTFACQHHLCHHGCAGRGAPDHRTLLVSLFNGGHCFGALKNGRQSVLVTTNEPVTRKAGNILGRSIGVRLLAGVTEYLNVRAEQLQFLVHLRGLFVILCACHGEYGDPGLAFPFS